MLRIRIRMEFTPHALDEARRGLRSLVGPIRAEPGCRATRVTCDLDDGGAVTFEAEWRDLSAFSRHLRGAGFRTLLAIIELAAEAPCLEIDEISSRRGFEMIEEVLGPFSEGRGRRSNRQATT